MDEGTMSIRDLQAKVEKLNGYCEAWSKHCNVVENERNKHRADAAKAYKQRDAALAAAARWREVAGELAYTLRAAGKLDSYQRDAVAAFEAAEREEGK